MFAVDYTGKETVWGHFELDVQDKDQAEFEALNMIRDGNPDISDVEITSIKEI